MISIEQHWLSKLLTKKLVESISAQPKVKKELRFVNLGLHQQCLMTHYYRKDERALSAAGQREATKGV